MTALAAGLLFWVGGCQPGRSVAPDPVLTHGLPELPELPADARTLGIYDIAEALDLRVVRTSSSFFTLRGERDTVTVFTFDGAQFYVNGKPCGPVGPVEVVDRSTRFQASLVDRLRPYLNTGPTVAWRRPRSSTSSGSRGTIVIDPGHGGHDPGTTSVLGYEEKTINLTVARFLAEELRQQGFRVILTRDRDVYVDLEERAAIANRARADLFVSVHADSNPSPEIRGFSVFVARQASSRSRQAARRIVRAMEATGIDSRGIREADYRVLVKTRCPAVLVELGHLSNAWEARRLREIAMQRRLARAIADGTLSLWAAAQPGRSGPIVEVLGK